MYIHMYRTEEKQGRPGNEASKEGLVFGDASSTRVEIVLEELLQRVHLWL